jgi:diguanylate cyclase (GGDEF)-like protein
MQGGMESVPGRHICMHCHGVRLCDGGRSPPPARGVACFPVYLAALTGRDSVAVSVDVHQHLNTLVAERRRGFILRFGPFLEEEFRRHYAETHYPKTRPLLVILLGLIFVSLTLSVLQGRLSLVTGAFALGFMMPALTATLVLSYREGSHRLYQNFLALSAIGAGLVLTSFSLRGSLAGQSFYFGALVAWVFSVWLALGLRFPRAAVTAVTVSLVHTWGMFHWNLPSGEVLFSGVALLASNLLGAYCCFTLESAQRRAYLESRTLNELAERDGLTGLYNRRRYEEHINKVWRQSRRDQEQFSIVLIDIDHFKDFNDRYGHQAGDDALKRVAEMIALSAKRPLDFAARFGGEEFALILYGYVNDEGRNLPEELRRSVESLKIPHSASPTAPWLTVSVGVAIVTPGAERSLAGAIQLADEALYQAKEEGRNRVVIRESRLSHLQTGRFRANQLRVRA